MKVTKIEPYKAKDQTDRWKIQFGGDAPPLIMGEQPTFQEGTAIAKNTLRRINKGTYSYYVIPGEGKKSYKDYNRSPEQSASIEGQTVFKALVEIFLAGKMDEFESSENPFVMGIRRYAERRLVQDHPYTKDALADAK